MARMRRYIPIALIVAFVIFVVILVLFFNQQNSPCPAAGCSTAYVSGGVSITGIGNPSKVEFTSASGQVYTSLVSGSMNGNFLYGLSLPNNQDYSVTVTSSFGGSCSAGNLNLNSVHPAYVWNANC